MTGRLPRRNAFILAAFLLFANGTARADDGMGAMHHHTLPGMEAPVAPNQQAVQSVAAATPEPQQELLRQASGTSWQPQSVAHEGYHFMLGDWMMMAHASAYGVYDNQGGRRGNSNLFSSSFGMLSGQHQVGADGVVSLRGMMSLDPLMGPRGYPLLLAAGETADGKSGLVDRQHPHDLVDELSATYAQRLNKQDSVFIYGGLPGEPALGPTAFMHRASSGDSPEAPLTHHWMDSTHVSFGVVTAGYVHDAVKIEVSAFRGREPDQHRYDIEQPKLDSVSARLSFDPTPNWSLQTSWGYLKSPEQLTPDVNENRVTASATYNLPFGENHWATTGGWGRKYNHPGNVLDGFLLESAVTLHDTHTIFARAERVDEDELLDGTPWQGHPVTVNKISLGYIHDTRVSDHIKAGIGGLVSQYAYPSAVQDSYGTPPTSFMLFLRLKAL